MANLHIESRRQARHFLSDVTEAQDAQRLSTELGDLRRPHGATSIPDALAQIAVLAEQIAVQSQHGHDHVLGHGAFVMEDVA